MRNQNTQKHVKATIYTQILNFDSNLKQVERERTSGNPGRHRGGVDNLTGPLFIRSTHICRLAKKWSVNPA